MLVTSKSAEETRNLAKQFIKEMVSSGETGPTIIELVGDLGAGKTTFMQGVGEFLGIKEALVSPTFVIQKNYQISPGSPWERLVHIDAYRIENSEELRAIAFDGYAKDPKNIIFIEWPTNMKIDLNPTKRIEFSHLNENEREIKI